MKKILTAVIAATMLVPSMTLASSIRPGSVPRPRSKTPLCLDAENKFTECGINHSKITHDLTDEKNGVETYMVDANYTDSDTTKYMGRVVYDTDTYDQSLEDAKENGDMTIDSYEPEKEVMTPKEEDDNAGVVRDKDGNVMSEATGV